MTMGIVNFRGPTRDELTDNLEIGSRKVAPLDLGQLALDSLVQNTSVGSFIEQSTSDADLSWQAAAAGKRFEYSPEKIMGTPFELRPDLLIGISTEEQFAQRSAFLQDQMERRERGAEAGLTGVGLSFATSLADPLNYFSFGVGAMVRGRGIARLLRTAGASGTAAVGGAAATEAVLQETQPFLTAEESTFSLMGAAALGMGLGALGGVVGSRRLARAAESVRRIADPEEGFVSFSAEGKAYAPNERVAVELKKHFEETGTASHEDINRIYQEFGDEIEGADLNGRVTSDGELMVSVKDIEDVLVRSGDETLADGTTPRADDLDPDTWTARQSDDLKQARQEAIDEQVAFARSVQKRYDVEGC